MIISKELQIDGEEPIIVTENIDKPCELVMEKRYVATNNGIEVYADTFEIHNYIDEFGNHFKHKEKIKSRYLGFNH